MSGNIQNTIDLENAVISQYTYNLRYDKRTGKFTCDCKGFGTVCKCHHINEFRQLLGFK
jgi:hypothetical protein